MTQEERQLLIKDLCARLPYEVQCEIGGLRYGPYTFTGNDVEDLIAGKLFKPYLRPISNITEEERQKFEETFDLPFAAGYDTVIKKTVIYDSIIIDEGYRVEISIDTIALMLDWLLAHHFDCHNLIPKGLAIEAPKGMYK